VAAVKDLSREATAGGRRATTGSNSHHQLGRRNRRGFGEAVSLHAKGTADPETAVSNRGCAAYWARIGRAASDSSINPLSRSESAISALATTANDTWGVRALLQTFQTQPLPVVGKMLRTGRHHNVDGGPCCHENRGPCVNVKGRPSLGIPRSPHRQESGVVPNHRLSLDLCAGNDQRR
jgi:hypothetical protein